MFWLSVHKFGHVLKQLEIESYGRYEDKGPHIFASE
jgi:hypothetical protein